MKKGDRENVALETSPENLLDMISEMRLDELPAVLAKMVSELADKTPNCTWAGVLMLHHKSGRTYRAASEQDINALLAKEVMPIAMLRVRKKDGLSIDVAPIFAPSGSDVLDYISKSIDNGVEDMARIAEAHGIAVERFSF